MNTALQLLGAGKVTITWATDRVVAGVVTDGASYEVRWVRGRRWECSCGLSDCPHIDAVSSVTNQPTTGDRTRA